MTLLPYRAPEHHPPSKVCVTEELMATYLQHLKLSSSSSPPSSSTSDLLNDHMLLVPEQEGRYSDHNQVTQQQQQQHQLNIKVVTSCPQSEESRLSRKRFSPGFGGLEEEEEEEEEVVVEEEEEGSGSEVDWSWSPGSKRARSEVDEVILQPTRSQGAELELLGQHSGGGSVLMSVSRTTASDLSSIPEEDAELLGQQTSATRLKGDGEMSSEIEKMQLASLNSSSSSSPSPSSDTVPEPLSSPPTLSPVSIESSSQDHCSIWVAPELKAMTSHNCPIPISIMKEMCVCLFRGKTSFFFRCCFLQFHIRDATGAMG